MVSKSRTGSPRCVAVRRPGASVGSLRTAQSLPDERHPCGANWPSTATVSVARQRGREGFGARRRATRARTARGGQPRWRVRIGLCVNRGRGGGGCAARRVAVGKQGMSERRGGRGVQSRACRAVGRAAATDAWDQVLSIPRVPVPQRWKSGSQQPVLVFGLDEVRCLSPILQDLRKTITPRDCRRTC